MIEIDDFFKQEIIREMTVDALFDSFENITDVMIESQGNNIEESVSFFDKPIEGGN